MGMHLNLFSKVRVKNHPSDLVVSVPGFRSVGSSPAGGGI